MHNVQRVFVEVPLITVRVCLCVCVLRGLTEHRDRGSVCVCVYVLVRRRMTA